MTNNEARTTVLLVLDETRRLASTGCEASAREVPALELALSLLEREPLVQAVIETYSAFCERDEFPNNAAALHDALAKLKAAGNRG
jgi:hypothetical protein